MSVSLHPSGTLGFPKPRPQAVKRVLTISNNNDHPVAFKIKTTAHKLYKLAPNSGRVEPGQSVEVQVVRQAMKEGPLLAPKCNDKFMVQSAAVSPEEETLSPSDIFNTAGREIHSQKINVVYLPTKGANVPEEKDPTSVLLAQPSEVNSGEQCYAIYLTDDHGALSTLEFTDTQEYSSFESTRKEPEPAPVISVAVRHPPPRRPRPRPSRDQILHELVEATAEVSRLGALLAATPEVGEEPNSMRGHRRAPSTVTGTETEASSYVDEPRQLEGASIPPKRLAISVMSETSSSSPSEYVPHDRVSDPTHPRRLIKFTNPKVNAYPDPPDPFVLIEDQGATPGAWVVSPVNPREGGRSMQPLEGPQTMALNGLNDNNPRTSNRQGDQQKRHDIQDKNNTTRKGANHNDARSPLPVLPPAPKNCFSREKIINKILDRTDQVTSVALFGPIGIGKSTVALTLLHHSRTKAKFGQNRHFMRCDDLTSSLDGFLERLSDTVHTDLRQLHAHLRSSPPLILLLDGVDFILDPLAPETRGISAAIQTFSSYEHVCLVTTSRMNPGIHGFRPVDVPTLSEDGARDTFHSLCALDGSSALDSLITRLDFHPLSIELLASCARENNWDEPMLLQACGDNTLKTSYYPRLKDAVEPALRSPTIKKLGAVARDVLGEIAALPHGIKEYKLERRMIGTGEVIDVLCKFSLVYRQDGFVKMLFPIRSYFAELTLVPPMREEIVYSDHPLVKSHITGPPGGSPAHATLRPVLSDDDQLRGRARPPTVPRRPPDNGLSDKLRPPKTPQRRKGIRTLLATVKKRLFALFGCVVSPTTPVETQDLASALPVVPNNRSRERLQRKEWVGDWASE